MRRKFDKTFKSLFEILCFFFFFFYPFQTVNRSEGIYKQCRPKSDAAERGGI